MQCPKCGAPVNPSQKFCSKCGQILEVSQPGSVRNVSVGVCPSCGAPVNPGQKFCSKCGAPAATSSQPQGDTKGFFDNLRHPVTFIRQGSQGVDRLVQRQREERLRQQAASMGLEVSKPPRGNQNVQQPAPQQPAPQQLAPQQPAPQQPAPQQPAPQQPAPQQPTPRQQAPRQQAPRQQASRQQAPRQQTLQPAASQQPVPQQSVPQQPAPQQRRLVVDNTSVQGVDLVSGRAIWDIQKGQIARLITESEFANAEGLKGVIVQEGCTATVFVDGQLVATMQAGCYTFPAKTQAEREIEQRQRELDAQHEALEKERRKLEEEERKKAEEYSRTFAARGVFGEVAAFGRGVMGFLFGKKKDEKPSEHRQRIERTRERLQRVPSPKICRVYIVSNRVFSLLFDCQTNAEGAVGFVPMLIPTKLVDVNITVSMQAQISNMQWFVTNYLADKKSVSVIDIQQMLQSGIKAMLSQILRNVDYQAEGLPEPIINNLKNHLKESCNERLQGIEIVRIMDITDSSADFERFRGVERELFASEKELGYMQRTNEFRNRLEQEQNRRAIDEATNAESLRYALQQVNKDKLLHDDELEQFVLLLESQQRIRKANLQKDEAVAMEEVRAALIDLKKCKLLKDDELAALEITLLRTRLERDDDTAAIENDLAMHGMNRQDDKDNLANEIEQRRIDRENITQIMRIQASQKEALTRQTAEFELSDNKMEHDMANALRQAQHQGNLAAAQLDTKRLMDAYNDERNEFEWNRAFTRRQQEDDYNFNQTVRQDDYDWQKEQREREANLRNRIQNEDYDYEKAKREQELREQGIQADYIRGRQDKFDDIDILERQGNISMRNMMAMKEKELEELEKMNRSAENIHQMDTNVSINRDNVEATMTAEQLMAKNAAKLDAGAQAAYANALGSGNKVKAEMLEQQNAQQAKTHEEMVALYQQMLESQKNQGAQDKDFMLKMAQMMQSGMLGAAGAQMATQQQQYQQQQQCQQQLNDMQQQHMQQRYDDQVARADEYRQDAYHQQDRMDHTQDTAIGSMAQIDTAMAGNLGAFNGGFNGSAQQTAAMQQPTQKAYEPAPQSYEPTPQQPATRYCPACGAEVPEGDSFCPECGQRM